MSIQYLDDKELLFEVGKGEINATKELYSRYSSKLLGLLGKKDE
jgi:hypothetical protein